MKKSITLHIIFCLFCSPVFAVKSYANTITSNDSKQIGELIPQGQKIYGDIGGMAEGMTGNTTDKSVRCMYMLDNYLLRIMDSLQFLKFSIGDAQIMINKNDEKWLNTSLGYQIGITELSIDTQVKNIDVFVASCSDNYAVVSKGDEIKAYFEKVKSAILQIKSRAAKNAYKDDGK